MKTVARFCLVFCICTGFLPGFPASAQEEQAYGRTRDVIYGRKHGMALTMDVFTPEKPNGAGVIYTVSGGWFSSHASINPALYSVFLRRGYTVFAVVHGSQPRFTIPEAVQDMNRAVRFIRHNATVYNIDPGRIGISGGSAGGHLSLMVGAAGTPGDPRADDPVERTSSRVQAVACFFPPTDFSNYGEPGRDVFRALEAELKAFKAPFDFVEMDRANGRFLLVKDEGERKKIAGEVSPISHVSGDDPPTLIVHGDADDLVPIQQSHDFVKAMTAAGANARIIVKTGKGHGWQDWVEDIGAFADWFDKHLTTKAEESAK